MINLSNNDDILKFALENGMIDIVLVQEQILMKKRKEYLEKHPFSVWEDKDGIWHTYLPDKEKGRIPKKRSTKQKIEDLIVEYWEEEETNPTIREIFNEWSGYKLELKEISKPTYDRYKVDFEKYFDEFSRRKIKTVQEEEIEDFILRQISKYELTAKGYANLRTIVYGIFKRAKKKKYINYSITQLVADIEISKNTFRKTIKEDYQEVFMEDEEPKIIEYLKDNMDILNLGIMLAFATGVRVGELVTIKYSDISGNVIRIRRTETRYLDDDGKNVFAVKDFPKSDAGVRDVVIPDCYEFVLKKIKLLNPFGEYILMKNGERVHTYTIRKRLYKACKETGVYPKSPHKIRKTYGTILLDNNVDSSLIIQQMGHTDILTTEKHYHRNRKSLEHKSMILNQIPELMAK